MKGCIFLGRFRGRVSCACRVNDITGSRPRELDVLVEYSVGCMALDRGVGMGSAFKLKH